MIELIKKRIHNIKIALRHIWESSPRWTVISFFLLIFRGVLPLLSLYLLKLIVDKAAVIDASNAAQKADSLESVVILIVLSGVVAIVAALLQSASNLVHEIQVSRVTMHVYDILHAKCIEVDLGHYENSSYHDKFHRAKNGGQGANRTFTVISNLESIIQNGISLMTMFVVLAVFHWLLVVFLILALIPSLLVYLNYSDKQYSLRKKRTAMERKCLYYSSVITEEKNAKEVRLFGLGELFRQRFLKAANTLHNERIDLAKKRSMAEALIETGSAIAVFGAFAFIAYRTLSGVATLGDLVMYYLAFQRAQDYLRSVLRGLSNLYEDALSLSDFHDFLNITSDIPEPANPQKIANTLEQGITFKNVSFSYPQGTRPVLDDVSLHIKPGEHVAFVGTNGSGKTTLIKLLCRLYDPTGGHIAFDNVKISDLTTTDLRRRISVVFQDYVQYQLTARENIWLGDIDTDHESDKILTAAELSGIDKVIDKLPHGYESVLGRWFEEGEGLSLGEWQKVAIARAFVRDTGVLILDEPSSALDASAEAEVFKQYHQLSRGKTTILISHRLSTVKMVDTIHVLKDGKIVESGNHDALMASEGVYAELYNKQAKSYQ